MINEMTSTRKTFFRIAGETPFSAAIVLGVLPLVRVGQKSSVGIRYPGDGGYEENSTSIRRY